MFYTIYFDYVFPPQSPLRSSPLVTQLHVLPPLSFSLSEKNKNTKQKTPTKQNKKQPSKQEKIKINTKNPQETQKIKSKQTSKRPLRQPLPKPSTMRQDVHKHPSRSVLLMLMGSPILPSFLAVLREAASGAYVGFTGPEGTCSAGAPGCSCCLCSEIWVLLW